MKEILKDRIKLIRAIITAKDKVNSAKKNEAELAALEEIICSIRKNTDDFLSISKKNRESVTYSQTTVGKFQEEKRIVTTLSRYIRRRLEVPTSKISDETLDKLSAIVKECIMASELDKQMKVLKGQDIVEAYRNARSTSCMTGSESEKVEIYALNPDKVSLIVHNEARALLWKCDDGTVVLDRVYPAQCHEVNLIRTWAEQKGYVLRKNPDRVVETGYAAELSDKKVHGVTLKHKNLFPYMDTFVYATFGEKTIEAKNETTFGNMVLHNTQGTYERVKVCIICNNKVNDGDYTIHNEHDIYCYKCFDKLFFCCDYCGNNKIAGKDGKNFLFSGHCLCNDCFGVAKACKVCGDHGYHTDMAFVDNEYYCYDCYVEHLVGCTKCKKRYPKGSPSFAEEGLCKECKQKEEVLAETKAKEEILIEPEITSKTDKTQ